MRGIAVVSRGIQSIRYLKSLDPATINGIILRAGVIELTEPHFDRNGETFRGKVLIRKKAFSLNFRDRRQILLAADSAANGYYVVGSDFCAEVIETAVGVENFEPGDRVVANNCYPEPGSPDSWPGVLTNHASKEYEVLPAGKLMRIPDALGDIQAAGFSIGAQTVYAMLRRLEPERGSRFLITAARSNTALFAIEALRRYGVRLSVATTSTGPADRFKDLGAERIYSLSREPRALATNPEISESCRDQGGFRYVIDPFFDLHFPHILALMATGGKYISCGILGQPAGAQPVVTVEHDAMVRLLVGNIHCMGNCLGSTEDLRRAIEDAGTGAFHVPVDSVFTGDSVGPFLERTFNDPDRFGKVIYQYV